ncbi:TauD/TfdA family dioxygenase [Streptomyces sp. WAC06614]|uniref:TauD/TfdA family dioxygenase n=1 Tax=Streptomyces sp. WAC06614 TaxID=2487416 RepID=UPI000F778347|nr:TauD/TfdA family dioxygenase [Streptomyces sp. WAC06614]RSS54538.1 TauD/TfdA family dioxygenase [Streptomyces sp. WAC06614]
MTAEGRPRTARLTIGSAVPLDRRGLLTTRPAPGSGGLLKIVEPQGDARLDAAGIVRQRREELAADLYRHGALLLRGFGTADTDAFDEVVRAFSDALLAYEHRSTPRTRIKGGIYTSTEYPPDQVIPLHNELTHTAPRHLWFCCLTPAPVGGATPIADTRALLRLLPTDLAARFARHGILYVRNYHPDIDLPWQEVFGTDSKQDVEAYCTEQDMEWEWVDADHLRTRQLCHAVVTHPVTGTASWFNQAHLFHHTRVGAEGAASLLKMFGKENLPRNTYLGNGQDITDDELATIRAAYDQVLHRFPWQAGDMLLVDNLSCAHGRDTYQGDRRVVVAMTDSVDCRTLTTREI